MFLHELVGRLTRAHTVWAAYLFLISRSVLENRICGPASAGISEGRQVGEV